jgi:hypothetical protein
MHTSTAVRFPVTRLVGGSQLTRFLAIGVISTCAYTLGVFLADYAVLYGTASVEPGGAADLLQRLGRLYVSPDFEFPLGSNPGPGYLLRTRVDRITGHGPWAGQ